MPKEQPDDDRDYTAYLLRLWKSNEAGSATWRASLESMTEGCRHNFAGVEALVTFLQKRFGALRADQQVAEDDQPHSTPRRDP